MLLSDVAARAGRALDILQVATDLSESLVGRFADSCAVYLLGPGGLERVSVAKLGADLPEDRIVVSTDAPVPLAAAYRSGRPLVARWTDELMDAYGMSGELRRADAERPTHTVLVAPVVVASEVVAVLQFGASGDRAVFGEDDVALAVEIAARAARPIENALRYRNEHLMAESLREAVLPERSPRLSGLEIDTYYRPAASWAGVGGDWYDAFEVDGHGVVVLGDVMGKGVTAALVMTEIRNALRAYAISDPEPAAVISRLRRFLQHYNSDTLVTLAYVLIDPSTGLATVSHAGHPPALHVTPGSEPQWVGGHGPLLAALTTDMDEEVVSVLLGPADRLLLYSDGLVESRQVPVARGMQELADQLRDDPTVPLDALVSKVDPSADDDITILSVGLQLSA
jgi:hypothetical protein